MFQTRLISVRAFVLGCTIGSMNVCALCSFAQESTLPNAESVRVEKGIAYLPTDRVEKADLYLPAKHIEGQRFPGVVIIHGGGWTGGKRDAAREINIGTTLASKGYVCLSIDYYLHDPKSDRLCWPQNLHDCKIAVRWMRANAAKLHLNPDRIGVIGGSAGGHLSCMVGFTDPEDGLDPTDAYDAYSCSVACVIDMYGPTDVSKWKDIVALRQSREEAPELYQAFSVLKYLDKNDPPVLILHGTADTTVDVEQSTLLADQLKRLGVEHQIEIIDGAPHTFHLQPKQKDLRPIVLSFLNKHLKQ